MSVINIEMIGRRIYKNYFFVTGASESNLFKILKKNLQGFKFIIEPDRDWSKNLFARSDNYPFALKGILAHTIMSSNVSVQSLVNGFDSPKRISLK